MLQRGRVVLSLAGRDKDRLLAVLAVDPAGYLLVADGKERPLERPKRKNPRHVAQTRRVLGEAAMATNRELRRALAQPEDGGKKPAQEPGPGEAPRRPFTEGGC